MSSQENTEEIVANVLHILSTYTKTSPLIGRCSWEKINDKVTNVSWAFHNHNTATNFTTHYNFLSEWLDTFLRPDDVTGFRTSDNDKVIQVKSAFENDRQMDRLMNDSDLRPSDDFLWEVGFGLLRSHLFTNESEDSIAPHELLQIVMDSYYCNDEEEDSTLGDLSATHEISTDEQTYYLSTPIAMSYLRTFLMCHTLQQAKALISDTSKPIRWKRLRSIVNDCMALYQRMLFDYTGKAIDNFLYVGQPDKTMKIYPIQPLQVISVSSWLYTAHLFPSCKDLLLDILSNEVNKSSNSKGIVKVLESCYNCFKIMTTLLALDAVVKQDYDSPTDAVQWVLNCIKNSNISEFFVRVVSAQKTLSSEDESVDEMSDDDEEIDEMYQPWSDRDLEFNDRGTSLVKDFLLYPSIRRRNDDSNTASDNTYYDELGIAILAYWKLRAQVDSSLGVDPLPPLHSGSHLWSLIFPHINTLINGTPSSSTIRSMDELEFLSSSDEYFLGMNLTIYSLGFDMLHILINQATAIRPDNKEASDSKPIDQWVQSAQGLEFTIAALLSHVVRLSSLEMSMADTSPSDVYPALKYSSLEVMNMTRTLLSFHPPSNQIETLLMVCQRVKYSQDRVIIPRVLDFIRPIIFNMCQNTEQYVDGDVAFKDMKILNQVSQLLDTFLLDMVNAFADSTSSLPKDIGEFMSSTETFAAVFAILRLQYMWISKYQALIKQKQICNEMVFEQFNETFQWMNGLLSELQSFGTSLSSFIAHCEESSDDAPQDFHHLYLLRLALDDVLNLPGGE